MYEKLILWHELNLTQEENFKIVLDIAEAFLNAGEIILLGPFMGVASLIYKDKLNEFHSLTEQIPYGSAERGEMFDFAFDLHVGEKQRKSQRIYYRDEKLIEFMQRRLDLESNCNFPGSPGSPVRLLDLYDPPPSTVICAKKQSLYNGKDYEEYLKYGSLQYLHDLEPPEVMRDKLNTLEDKGKYYYLTLLVQRSQDTLSFRRLYLYPACDNITASAENNEAILAENDEAILKEVFKTRGTVEAAPSMFTILPKF